MKEMIFRYCDAIQDIREHGLCMPKLLNRHDHCFQPRPILTIMKSLLLLATAGLIASAAAQGFWQPQCNTPLPELPANLTEPTWDACKF